MKMTDFETKKNMANLKSLWSSDNFTVNPLTSCQSGTQLEWRYGAIQYLSKVFVEIVTKNESIKIYFLFLNKMISKLYFK